MTVSIFKRRSKKSVDSNSNTDSEKIEFLVDIVLAVQKDQARLRQDVREIVREEIKSILDGRQRSTGVFAV